MLSVALYSDNLLELLVLGVATGVGAGLGEIVSYAIAYNIAAQIQELSKSALFRWIRRTIHDHPRTIPIMVFIGALFPIPDDLVIMPLAMLSYPVRKLMLPMFSGKVIHNVSVAFVFHYATDTVRDQVSGDVNVDLSLGILIVFIMIILYQIEKVRQSETEDAA
jgi:membrane protein YqaA with SNARE-associated domain